MNIKLLELKGNEDAALKIMAMSYRYNRYVNEKREKILPIVVNAINGHSGVATDSEELSFLFDTFLGFRTYQTEKLETFNPQSEFYWEKFAKYYVEQTPTLPEGFNYSDYNLFGEWFAKFLAREDLIAWVDAPLE
jgi:hypothetical protein